MLKSGKDLSKEIKEKIKAEVAEYTKTNRKPCLITILVGDDPASKVYVSNKEKACNEVGIHNITERYPADMSESDLLSVIRMFNISPNVDGILVQLPLPKHIDTDKVMAAISPEKDVDGFHPENVANLWLKKEGVVPCTPKGIMELLDSSNVNLEGQHVVVIGRSNIVGLPIAKLCLDRNATVTICHSKTENLADITRQADVLIVAIGKPKFVTADMVKLGAVVIDVGINRVDGKLCGDVDFDSVFSEKTERITPVPGGVGPMTICELLSNTLFCYLKNFSYLCKRN